MKILLFSLTGFTADTNYISRLGNSLAKLSNDVALFLPDYANLDGMEGLNKILFSHRKALLPALVRTANPSLYEYLFRQINVLSPDVIHVTFELRVPFFLIKKLHRKYPIVTTIHEPIGISHTLLKSLFLNHLQEFNVKLLAKSSDNVIVHGQNHKSYLVSKNISSDKLFIIPHGPFTFPNHVFPIISAKHGPNVLFFGNINPYKGIEYLIKAGKQLSIKLPEVTITIAGSGDFSKYTKLINGDSHFIVHNRFIPEQEAAEFFQQASLIVLPYKDGSQSGNISLAGSFKKPVIATRVGNLAEMVIDGKTGILISPRDSSALTETMYKVLTEERMQREMGENAYNLFLKFTWDDVAQRTMETYQGAIRKWQFKHKNGLRHMESR